MRSIGVISLGPKAMKEAVRSPSLTSFGSAGFRFDRFGWPMASHLVGLQFWRFRWICVSYFVSGLSGFGVGGISVQRFRFLVSDSVSFVHVRRWAGRRTRTGANLGNVRGGR